MQMLLIQRIYLISRIVILLCAFFIISCGRTDDKVSLPFFEDQVIFEFYGPFEEQNIPLKVLNDSRYRGSKNILNGNGIMYYLVLLGNVSDRKYTLKMFSDSTPVIQAFYFNYCERDDRIDYCYSGSNSHVLSNYKLVNHSYHDLDIKPNDTSLFLVPVNSILLNNVAKNSMMTNFQDYSINCFFPQFSNDNAMNNYVKMKKRGVLCNSCYYLEQSVFIVSKKDINEIRKTLKSKEVFDPNYDDLNNFKNYDVLLEKVESQLKESFSVDYLEKIEKDHGNLANYNNSLYPTKYLNNTKNQIGDTIFEWLDFAQ